MDRLLAPATIDTRGITCQERRLFDLVHRACKTRSKPRTRFRLWFPETQSRICFGENLAISTHKSSEHFCLSRNELACLPTYVRMKKKRDSKTGNRTQVSHFYKREC